MKRSGNDLLAGSRLTCNENVCVRRTHARDQLQHRSHGLGFRNHQRLAFGAQQPVLRFQPLPLPQCIRQRDLRLHNAEQPRVFPGLLDEVTRASPHRLDGKFDTAPGSHHDHRNRRIETLNLRQQIETFLPGRGVPGIVQVHDQRVVIAHLQRVKHGARRRHGLG